MSRIDLAGKKFGRLEVLRYSHSNKKYDAFWTCRCSCGNIIVVRGSDLKNGHTQSCGCFQREKVSQLNTTHGMEGTRLNAIWKAMLSRCYNSSGRSFYNYGGRGISVCEEWRNSFQAFHDWAMANGYKPDAKYGECTIDRIDVNGDYSPENCRWVTNKEQANNKRNNRIIEYGGKAQTMQQWADELGLDSRMIYNRITRLRWDVGKALFTPINNHARGAVD